jgi:hypothetical protein
MNRFFRLALFVLIGMAAGVPFTLVVIISCNVAGGEPHGMYVIENSILLGLAALLASVTLGGVAGSIVWVVVDRRGRRPPLRDTDDPYRPVDRAGGE